MTKPGDFSNQADAYARARPSYPEAIVDRLLARAEVDAADDPSVVEIGAGTGLFTERLAARGLRVLAIEPGGEMRAHAPTLAGVQWRDATFERPHLAPESVDWIVAAQAFHWAEPTIALPTLRRALRPGRRFSVLWNDRDVPASPLLTHTRAAIERMIPNFDEGYRHRDWAAVLVGTGDFEAVEGDEVRHAIAMTHTRFLDLWRSHNKLNTAAAALGLDAMPRFLDDIAEYLTANCPNPVAVPYRCRAWTARRVD